LDKGSIFWLERKSGKNGKIIRGSTLAANNRLADCIIKAKPRHKAMHNKPKVKYLKLVFFMIKLFPHL
jgi:hypothetical protein